MLDQRHPPVEVARRTRSRLTRGVGGSAPGASLGSVLLRATADALDGDRPEPAAIGTRVARAVGLSDDSDATHVGQQALVVIDALTQAARRAERTTSERLVDSVRTAGAQDPGTGLRGLVEAIEYLTTVFVITVDSAPLDGQSAPPAPWEWV